MPVMSIECPSCCKYCSVPIEEGDLIENGTTEGFEWQCQCGCAFHFDVHLEIMNKEKEE